MHIKTSFRRHTLQNRAERTTVACSKTGHVIASATDRSTHRIESLFTRNKQLIHNGLTYTSMVAIQHPSLLQPPDQVVRVWGASATKISVKILHTVTCSQSSLPSFLSHCVSLSTVRKKARGVETGNEANMYGYYMLVWLACKTGLHVYGVSFTLLMAHPQAQANETPVCNSSVTE